MRCAALATAVLLLAVASARATTVTADFVKVDPNRSATYTVWWSEGGGGAHSGSTLAGIYWFDQVNPKWDGLPSRFPAFCIDVNQYCNWPTVRTTFEVKDPADAPDPYPGSPGTMGTDRELALSKLFYAHYDDAMSGVDVAGNRKADRAAAFQFGVWEIVWENTNKYEVNGSDMSDRGGFYVSCTTDQAVALADAWLGELSSIPDSQVTALAALVSGTKQDQIVLTPKGYLPPVPEPLTVAGLFLGLASVAGYIRKRRMA